MSFTYLEIGRVFAGDFRVLGLIAEGGMGTVYEVEQLSTRKRRALKLVRAALSEGKGRQRFVQEATIGASIDSAHIVEVIGAGVDNEVQPWLAMELLRGGDLGALAAHHGPLTPSQLLEMFRQLCHGLGAAHRAGVVHRDLKPANIFVARPNRAGMPFTVKILDFGIAKLVEGARSGATKTETVGSPMWMAPEQLDARRPSPRTDVWALGLIAFWALTGEYYWRSAHQAEGNVQALFVEQLFKPIDAPSVRAVEYGQAGRLPEGFDAWFAHCTVRDEGQRYADADAAFAALCAALPAVDPGQASAEASALVPDFDLSPSSIALGGPSAGASARTLDSATAVDGPGVTLRSALAPTIGRTGPLGADASQIPDSIPRGPTPPAPYPLVVIAVVLAVITAVGGLVIWSLVSGGETTASDDAAPALLARNDPSAPARAATEPAAGLAPPAQIRDPEPQAAAPPVQAASSDATPPDAALLALVVPLYTQLDPVAHDVDFLGWTPDASRFVVAVTRIDDGSDPERRQLLRLVQVHDALTGMMLESYVTQYETGASVRPNATRKRTLAEANDLPAWRARKKTLGLLPPAPHRDPPDSALVVEADLDPASKPGRVDLVQGARGFRFRWYDTPMPATTQQGQARGPTLQITARQGEKTWPMLETRIPFSVAELASRRPLVAADAVDQPAVSGRVDLQWSPDGQRVVIVVESTIEPEVDSDHAREARFYVRGAGPQIRIMEAGAGQGAARAVALALGRAGLPVASIELRQAPVADSSIKIRHGHDGGDALAERLAEALGRALPSRRVRQGWSTAVVVLGHDAAG